MFKCLILGLVTFAAGFAAGAYVGTKHPDWLKASTTKCCCQKADTPYNTCDCTNCKCPNCTCSEIYEMECKGKK